MASNKKTPKADEGKNKPFRPYGRKPGEETKGGLPMLRFGIGNNFYKFKAQLSNVAIEKYGNLGKLIELEKYYAPALVIPDFRAMGVSAANVGTMELEAVKGHIKRLEKMVEDRPKLYGLIMQHATHECGKQGRGSTRPRLCHLACRKRPKEVVEGNSQDA